MIVKVTCISAMVVGIFAVALFSFDLAVGFPFSRASVTADIGFIVAGALLALGGWSAKRELT